MTRVHREQVIVFELTGQLSHMLPVLVAVLLAYGVGNACNTSIYDTMMTLNNNSNCYYTAAVVKTYQQISAVF